MALREVKMVTVVGAYRDVTERPYTGTVAFTPTAWVDDPSGTVFPQAPVTVTLDADGAFSVQLVATSSPELEPAGWVYQITETIEGRVRTVYAAITKNCTISELVPLVPPQEWESTRGPRGFSVLSGPRPPTPADGEDGDSWVDTVLHEYWAPKSEGQWGEHWFMGGQGVPGPPGPQGPPGAVAVFGPQPYPPDNPTIGTLWLEVPASRKGSK